MRMCWNAVVLAIIFVVCDGTMQAKMPEDQVAGNFYLLVGVADQSNATSTMMWASKAWQQGVGSFTNSYLTEHTTTTSGAAATLGYNATSWLFLEASLSDSSFSKEIYYGYDASWVNGIPYGSARYDFGQVFVRNSPEVSANLVLIDLWRMRLSVGLGGKYLSLDGEHEATTDGEKYPTTILGGNFKPLLRAGFRFPLGSIFVASVQYEYCPVQLETALTPAGNMETYLGAHTFWFSIGFPLVTHL